MIHIYNSFNTLTLLHYCTADKLIFLVFNNSQAVELPN